MSVSLTKFMDFVNSTGLEKRNIAIDTSDQKDYASTKDFYKEIRKAIISLHKNNEPLNSLKKIVISNEKKSNTTGN